ncbi:MAG: pentapeptide repeat-containing protein [Bacilli bacterium]|nr:pentapeptide repeat-containing protein [Bacilli bacterium]
MSNYKEFPTVEKENIYERQHSCKWYFDEAVDFYDYLVGEEGSKNSPLGRIKEAVGEHSFAYNADTKTNELSVGLYNKPDCVALDGSVFPLFLYDEKWLSGASKKESAMEVLVSDAEFERKKFEICKVLNTIDAIVDGLCNNNVDSTVLGLDSHIIGRETVLQWLYTGSSTVSVSKQEEDRAEVFYKQVLTWWLKGRVNNFMLSPSPMDKLTREQCLNAIAEVKVESDLKVDFINRVRSSFNATIKDIHDAFQRLNGFRKYAIGARLATDEMKDETRLSKVYALAKGILDFFLSVCVSYMRIDELQLPRAQFTEAKLSHANISHSNFASSDFSKVTIDNGNARDCDFSMSTLEGIQAQNADFTGALFSYANLAGGNYEGAVLSKAKIDSVSLGHLPSLEIMALGRKAGYPSFVQKEWPDEKLIEESKKSKEDVEKGLEVPFLKRLILISNECSGDKNGNDFILHNALDGFYGKYNDLMGLPINDGKALSCTKGTFAGIVTSIKDYNRTRGKDKPRVDEPSEPVCLRACTLDEALIPNADLSIVDLSNASLREAIMPQARMSYADARGANFGSADLFGVYAYESRFDSASFRDSLFGGGMFVGCNFNSANFDGATFLSACFLGKESGKFVKNYMKETKDYGYATNEKAPSISEPADINMQDMSPTDDDSRPTLLNSSFKNCNGTKAVFAAMDMSRSSFNSALLRSAAFLDCNATSTRFDEADLTFSIHHGVLYTRSSFKHSSFQEAKIASCDFTCCNMSNAKFLAGTLKQCVFHDASLKATNFSHSNVSHCIFRDTLVDGMMISGARFENCIFIGIDFTDIIGLSRATFTDCMFINCYCDGEKLTPKAGMAMEDVDADAYIAVPEKNFNLFARKGEGYSVFAHYTTKIFK